MKTLKEMKASSKNPMFNMGADTQIKVIKQEAIKWVRNLKEEKKELETDLETECYGKIIALMEFFNITEDNLK